MSCRQGASRDCPPDYKIGLIDAGHVDDRGDQSTRDQRRKGGESDASDDLEYGDGRQGERDLNQS